MDLQNAVSDLYRKMLDAEESVLKDVLFNLLKREPTIEDFKNLTKYIQEGENERYYLAYKNLKLGVVKYNFGFESKMGVEFIPLENGSFLEPALNEDGTKVTFTD